MKVYAGARVIGVVKDNIFQKNIHGSRHMLRKPPAIALSIDSLEQAKALGAKAIEVFDKDTRTVYSASVEHFFNRAFRIQRGGFEPQLAMALDDWHRTSVRGRRMDTENEQRKLRLATNRRNMNSLLYRLLSSRLPLVPAAAAAVMRLRLAVWRRLERYRRLAKRTGQPASKLLLVWLYQQTRTGRLSWLHGWLYLLLREGQQT